MAPRPIKCKNTEPYILRPLAGEFKWLVYNAQSGYIVASTHSQNMAEVIAQFLNKSNDYKDAYAITEMWEDG